MSKKQLYKFVDADGEIHRVPVYRSIQLTSHEWRLTVSQKALEKIHALPGPFFVDDPTPNFPRAIFVA